MVPKATKDTTESSIEQRVRRVLLAMDNPQASAEALEAAVELAHQLRAELRALFVEDVDLLRLAELPFAKRVVTQSGSDSALDPNKLERALRAEAEDARKGLRSVAERARVRWSFEIVRGHAVDALLSASAETDLLIVGRGRELYVQRLVVRGRRASVARVAEAPVAVLFAPGVGAERVLAAAVGMARAAGEPLVVLLPDQDEKTAATWRDEAQRILEVLGASARFRTIVDAKPLTIAGAVRDLRAVRLVVGVEAQTDVEGRIQQLSRAVSCPLVMVR